MKINEYRRKTTRYFYWLNMYRNKYNRPKKRYVTPYIRVKKLGYKKRRPVLWKLGKIWNAYSHTKFRHRLMDNQGFVDIWTYKEWRKRYVRARE